MSDNLQVCFVNLKLIIKTMIRILKTIVTKLGGIDTSEKNHVDTFTEGNIISVKGEKIAKSNNGGIWIEFQDLSSYHFMNITVIGNKKIKTLDGCKLSFNIKIDNFILNSDTKEIESDFSNISNRYITSVSFDITNINIDFITNKATDFVELIVKKEIERFEIIK